MILSNIASPKTGSELISEYYIENRTRLLEIASYLDRLDRVDDEAANRDFRMRAFREALVALSAEGPGRTERIQLIFSDPTTEPREMLDQKSARGAYDRWKEGE